MAAAHPAPRTPGAPRAAGVAGAPGPGPRTGPGPGPGPGSGSGPDAAFADQVDELRTHTLEWLRAARAEAVRAQRRWRMRELAIVRVLDERDR